MHPVTERGARFATRGRPLTPKVGILCMLYCMFFCMWIVRSRGVERRLLRALTRRRRQSLKRSIEAHEREVRIAVHGQGDGAVPRELLDLLGVRAGFREIRQESVPKCMKVRHACRGL